MDASSAITDIALENQKEIKKQEDLRSYNHAYKYLTVS